MSSTAGTTLQNTKWQSDIDACMKCAEACEFCATSDLKEQDVKMMASCAQINRECAKVCWTSASLMSMDSQFAKQFCNLCASICNACVSMKIIRIALKYIDCLSTSYLSQSKNMFEKIKGLYYAAAATTAIAGILHLIQASNVLGFSLLVGIFFIVAGIAQLFWVVPMIRRWGRPWYYVGIGGTIVLIILFVITRMPDNPITGRGGPVSPMALAIEVLQAAFIGLSVAIIVYEMKRKRISGKTASETA